MKNKTSPEVQELNAKKGKTVTHNKAALTTNTFIHI
jgi:hypothetical protein